MAEQLLESFKARYPFPLDAFQLRAIDAILDGKSVIVSAPTGSGKTLVAEFAIHAALRRDRRIAYTTPLKALSNQKYADFGRQWGSENVGILTGDVKVNARAPVVVMTTEILRNMFYSGGLNGLDTVVLDECHYMGDEGRGTVWEEIIVNCPKDVALVALSATVRNVTEIADWISLVHRPIVAITHPHRPVPLQYLVADLSGEIHTYDAVRHGKVRLLGEEREGGYHDRGRWYTRRVVDPTVMLDELESRGWLPAIYFIFSRAGCERAMETVLAEGKPLLSREQQGQVDGAIREQITESPAIAESPLNQTIFQALGMGVGLHHAGILPTVKRFTELLFERGLCKVVFATETMSLGIHMPAKSVVLQSLTKRTDRGFRSLTHNELTQMAGRAGRRGIDPEGKCVMALDVRDGFEDMKRVVDGPPEPVMSQFKLGYGSVALLLSTGRDLATIRRIVESSFGQYQNMKRIRAMEADVQSLEIAVADGRHFVAPCGDFARIGRYRALRSEVEVARMARGKSGRRGRSAADAEPGRLALVRRKSGASLGLIVGVDRRRHRNLIQVLLPHGGTVHMKEGNVKRVFWQTPPLHVPRDWEHRTRGLTEQLERLAVGELVERERSHGPEGALAAIECHRCPWGSQNRCEQVWKGVEGVERQLAQKTEMLDTFRNAYWQEFLRVVEVLERFGAVQDAKLLAKGQLIAGLRHDNELLVAEMVDRGVLADTTLAEAATLCSCLIEEARSGDAAVARLFLKKRPKLKRRLQDLESLAQTVLEVQRRHQLPMPVGVSTGFMPSVFRWASGEDDWAAIVEESFGGHEGDLIRAMRRLIDVLRQLAEAPEVEPALAALLSRAARVIDRGIVLESALI
ncbi:MAG TPA: DEAD/DEAH box helicase [Candidatus Dormibacteraeota bacterium]|nr:DEAD/DEAH box helicase [Candidatus Dormibacteraeota bacterium]